MITELDVDLPDGRTLHAYDTGGDDLLAVVWHHGTPNIGAPPEPLFPAAARLGIRWVSYDRPGYGGSSPNPNRDVGSAAADVAAVADALGIERFAVMGHSGGGPHALACGALLPARVLAVVSMAGLAPFGAEGLDWFAGMIDSGVASLRAAAAGRCRRRSGTRHREPSTTPSSPQADLAVLAGEWAWLERVVGPALAAGPGGLIADDLAYVAPWGFDPVEVVAPTLFVHGGRDRIVPCSHSEWLARQCPRAELRLSPDDGHLSILGLAGQALEWLRERAKP